MKLILAAMLLMAPFFFATAQQKLKPTISAYVMYGRHFQTNYVVDSGNHNLTGRRMYRSYEAGMNLDFVIGKNWGFRTGIYGHLHRVGEWFYGVSGVAPSFIESEQHRQNMKEYARGATEYIERSSIGIPLVPTYSCQVNDKISLLFSGGPVISLYFPV